MTTHPTNLTPADGLDDYTFFFLAIESHLGFAKAARDRGDLNALKVQAEFIRIAAGGLKDKVQNNQNLQPEPSANVRPERSFNQFSRGLEVVKAIKAMWAVNDAIPHWAEGRTETVNANIKAILDEFDLTVPEWHYWADIARKG